MPDFTWTEDLIKQIASEMYEDGTSHCERYSQRTLDSRGWPLLDNEAVIGAIDAYLKFLKSMDIYNGRKIPEYRTDFSVGIRKAVEESKKT